MRQSLPAAGRIVRLAREAAWLIGIDDRIGGVLLRALPAARVPDPFPGRIAIIFATVPAFAPGMTDAGFAPA